MFEVLIDPDEVQYLGIPGGSDECLLAVDTIVNSEFRPRRGTVVSWVKDRANRLQEHLFMFWDWNDVPLTVVHSGFTSGYSGQGPRCFSQALCMILDRAIPANMVTVNEVEFNAIERRQLTDQIIATCKNADGPPLGLEWYGWTFPEHVQQIKEQTFWRDFHQPKLSTEFLDQELAVRCEKIFGHDRESAVAAAFKVVEERLRQSVDIPHAYGSQLVKDTLDPEKGILTDRNKSRQEQEGLYALFSGAMSFVRNPRSHRFVDEADNQLDIELVYLADLLLRVLPKIEPNGTTE